MVKDRNEPIADIVLSYADIELILTALEHFVPRSNHDYNDGMELMHLMRNHERLLYRAKLNQTERTTNV